MPKLNELPEREREVATKAYELLQNNVPNNLLVFRNVFIHTFKCPKCLKSGAICFHGTYIKEKNFNVHVIYHLHTCGYFEDFFNHIKKEDLENYSIKISAPQEEPRKCPIPGCTREHLYSGIHVESSGC